MRLMRLPARWLALGLGIGLAASRNLLGQPVGALRRQGQDRDGLRGVVVKQNEAAHAIPAELQLEAVGIRCAGRNGDDGVVAHRMGSLRERAADRSGAAGPWVVVLTHAPPAGPKPRGPWVSAFTIGREVQAVDEFCGATLS